MSTQFDRSIFQERLKKARMTKYKTQAAFSDAIGISDQAVSYYESGKRLPDAGTLYLLANFFNCSIDWLLGISDNMYPDNSYVEKATGLNDAAIQYLSRGIDGKPTFSKETAPDKNMIFNLLLSSHHINDLINGIQEAAESLIGTVCVHTSVHALREDRMLEDMAKNGIDEETAAIYIASAKQFARLLDAIDTSERAELTRMQFIKSMNSFLDMAAAALSEDYGKWLLNKKQAELSNIESTIKEAAARGIDKT